MKLLTRHVKYDIIKRFAAFCVQFVLFHLKKEKNTQISPKNSLTTSYL